MKETNNWHETNNRLLALALSDLRQRLERFIQRGGNKPLASATHPEEADSSSNTISRSVVESSLAKPSVGETEISGLPVAAQPAHEAEQPVKESPSALDVLRRQLGLSQFEQDILLLCAATELDAQISGLLARAQGDPQKPFPTFALALALFDNPSWDALSPERPLRYWRLIEINQPGAQPLVTSAIRADERIVSFIKGLNYLDDRLAPFVSPSKLESAELSPSQSEVAKLIILRWQFTSDSGYVPVAQLLGADNISKQLVASSVAGQLNRRLYRLPVELLPSSPSELDSFARLWQRESLLLPIALFLDADELDGPSIDRLGSLSRFLERCQGMLFLATREIVPRLASENCAFDISKPSTDEQLSAWKDSLQSDQPELAANLAAQFNLNLHSIRQLGQLAVAESAGTQDKPSQKIWSICCNAQRPRLDALAQRLDPKMTWDDLVLSPTDTELLKQIASQVKNRNVVYNEWGFGRKMNRGFSISALFSGDSGTGKTMAAEVIANDLQLNLYRIDLSAVVNKYIGETEKNLRRLFDAAEDGGVILFFDEADALFGKRSEVKDSHDRYANIEINYLLQRLESYRGLAILATNMKGALDPAFIRRLRFVINFPFPSAADRRLLWKKAFAQNTVEGKSPVPPIDPLDYDRLARLNLSGGNIHTVALNSAFMAAALRVGISMPLILSAARAEYIKHNRPISEADFKWSEPSSLPKEMPKKELLVPA